jgi:hypothetical protein
MPCLIGEQTVMEAYIENAAYSWAIQATKDYDCFKLQDKSLFIKNRRNALHFTTFLFQ